MAAVTTSVAVLSILLTIYKLLNLYRFVLKAKSTGLPYVITPFLETEVIAFLLTPLLRWIYHDYLDQSKGWPRWCRFIIKDWSWEDKRISHEQYGGTFIAVSPEGLICYTADAALGWDVMNRRNDFPKPPDKYKVLEPYGPNVATTEGATYRFHVRITASTFQDTSGVNDLVWSETAYQTRKLGEAWSQGSPRHLVTDVNALTLALISRAGLGKRVEWTSNSDDDKEVPEGYRMGFLRAMDTSTAHIVAILIAPGWLLDLSGKRETHVARDQLEKYLREMIRTERKNIADNQEYQNRGAKGNLLTSVLQASNAEEKGVKNPGETKKKGFTEQETLGNLWLYLLAGYETTANAIVYGLITLALRPDVQANVMREIDSVVDEAKSQGRQELSYKEDFDKLEYTYGFMYETFRLFPGVVLITKMAAKEQTVTTSDDNKTHVLPAGTRVYLSSPGVHYNSRYWPDPYKLDPTRWMSATEAPFSTEKDTTSTANSTEKRVTAADRTRQMKGTLLTFSDGARACLGRKFAQAEYISFMVTLLRDYQVVLSVGQDEERVKKDLYLKCAGKLTLAPLEGVRLQLVERNWM